MIRVIHRQAEIDVVEDGTPHLKVTVGDEEIRLTLGLAEMIGAAAQGARTRIEGEGHGVE